jgi:hypothetical protein
MPSDTFAIQRDAALYVPRAAAERAVALLRQKLFGSAGIVALVGPPGIGKSVVAERAARGVERKVTCVRLRLESRSCEELCAAVVAELEASGAANDPSGDQGESPTARMRSWVRSEAEVVRTGPERTLVELSIKLRRMGRPLALFIDDADGISDRAVARLHELATSSRSIAICLVLCDEREFEGVPSKKLPVVRFDEPMSLTETTAYINTRLMRGDTPPELRQLLDDAMIRRVHAYSGGIPRRVHAEIALLQRDATARETARQDASTYPVVTSELQAVEPAPAFELPSRQRARWLTLGAAAGSAVSALAALALITFAPQLVLPRARTSVQPALSAQPVDMPSDFEPNAPSVVSLGTALDAEPPVPTDDTAPARNEDTEPPSRLQAVARPMPAPSAAPAPRPPVPAQAPPRKPVGTEVASSKPAPAPAAKPAAEPAPKVEPEAAKPAPAPAPTPTAAVQPAPSTKPQLFYADVNAVPRALITIDGVEIGQTPLGGLPLEEGIHQFRAVMPDGRVLERAILISKDRQRILFE